jgi:hypothetical protein
VVHGFDRLTAIPSEETRMHIESALEADQDDSNAVLDTE